MTVSWHHSTLRSLAQALGATTRTLELWREHGAPITTDGPHDELAIRIWHLGHAAQGKGKVKALSEPDAALVPYLTAARAAVDVAVVAAGANLDDPDRRLKDRQAHKLDLQNARTEAAMIRDAQAAFASLLGTLQQDFSRACAGKMLGDLWQACAKRPRLRAERDLRRILTERLATLIDTALDRAAKGTTP